MMRRVGVRLMVGWVVTGVEVGGRRGLNGGGWVLG